VLSAKEREIARQVKSVRPLRPAHVVVAGLDPRLLKTVAFLLSHAGCEVVSVRGFGGLLEAAVAHGAHVAVLDGSHGPRAAARAAERLRALEPPVPVLVLTRDTAAPALRDLTVLPKWDRLEDLADEVNQLYLAGAPVRGR
jgi:CheY-like chemotaxis protein